MPSNDFDNSIRDLLNGHSPEYNPADWDRMEDLLQNLPAAANPNAGAAQGAAGKVASGISSIGAKAWVVAAMVGLTAVNVAVLYSSNQEKTASSPEAKIETASESEGNQTAPAEVTTSPISQNQPEQASESTSASENNFDREEKTELSKQAVVEAKPAVPASEQEVARPGKFSGKSLIGDRSKPVGAAGNSQMATLSGLTMAKSGNATAAAPASGGNTEKASASAASVCELNNKPFVPFPISGLDTVKTYNFTLSACEPFCLRIPGQDSDAGDRIRFSTNLLQLKGARFEVSPEVAEEASFCWTPTSDQAHTEPYILKVNLQNEQCPGVNSVRIRLTVLPSAAVRITGDTLLMAGQQTRLKAVSQTSEASWKWLPANGLDANAKSREVVASPSRSTTYTLQMTNARGCMVPATHRVLVLENRVASQLFIPNIFTPNGDNINDRFEVKGIEPGRMELTITDRNGRTLYHHAQYDNTWDGNNLADGRYTLVLKNLDNGKTYRNTVELNRK